MKCDDCRYLACDEYGQCECRRDQEPYYNEEEDCFECDGYSYTNSEVEYWERYDWEERFG